MVAWRMSEFWSNESPFNIRLCTIVLSERSSSSLAIFLNGYEHIEVPLNPCKINLDQKGLEYYFEAPSISHLKNVLGGDNKDPWKGSRVNNILYINDPMPRIECQKVDKSRKLL